LLASSSSPFYTMYRILKKIHDNGRMFGYQWYHPEEYRILLGGL
jgi:hypothetical protein